MVMRLSTFGGGELTPYDFAVVPLTATTGLNQTADDRGVCAHSPFPIPSPMHPREKKKSKDGFPLGCVPGMAEGATLRFSGG